MVGSRRIVLHSVRVAVLASVALLLLGGPLHYVLFEHTRCASHGELVHATADSEHAHAHAMPHGDAQEPSTGSSATRAPVAGDNGHDHCPLAMQQRATLAVGHHAPLDLRPPAMTQARGEREPALLAAALERAPKTSPPRPV